MDHLLFRVTPVITVEKICYGVSYVYLIHWAKNQIIRTAAKIIKSSVQLALLFANIALRTPLSYLQSSQDTLRTTTTRVHVRTISAISAMGRNTQFTTTNLAPQ